MDVLVVIQARMGSTRLPGKVLAEVAGQPMLGFQIERLRPGWDRRIIVATSDLAGDDPIADFASAKGVDVVRGSEQDVLGRFASVLDNRTCDHLVRLTGDCPLSDPALVDAVVNHHLAEDADYTSNVHPRSFPKGLDVEVMTRDALIVADRDATSDHEREHVTPYLHDPAHGFVRANLSWQEDLGDLWWTVDTPEDLRTVRHLVTLVPDPLTAGWTEILEALRGGPSLSRSNPR